ncbi:MAG: hypothetical protein EBS06_05345 [Proteobacteria bacterium]|nr:hypothetical protein [Pseudomonadota bacterium]
MAKKQLFSTAFDEINKDLNEREAYFLNKIASNDWVSKTGIYKLHAVALASNIGFAKVLTEEEILTIHADFELENNYQKRQREIMSRKENMATIRLKNIFDILQTKGKLCYDYVNHLMYVKNFHQYVPFGNAKPLIICNEIVKTMESFPDHQFCKDYLHENFQEIKQYLTQAQANAERSKKPEELLALPSFLRLKSLIFKNDKKI